MKISTIIKLPTYACNVQVIICDGDIRKEITKICKKHKDKEPYTEYVAGLTLSFNMNKYYIFYHTDFLSHNTIAHELYHVVRNLTQDRDIKEEESQAWVVGYLTEEVYKFIKKKKLELKNG